MRQTMCNMPKHPRKTEAGDRKQEQLHREKSLDFEGHELHQVNFEKYLYIHRYSLRSRLSYLLSIKMKVSFDGTNSRFYIISKDPSFSFSVEIARKTNRATTAFRVGSLLWSLLH